jgi:hypothetical protein
MGGSKRAINKTNFQKRLSGKKTLFPTCKKYLLSQPLG